MIDIILKKLNCILISLFFCVSIFVPFFIGITEKDKDISKIEKRKLYNLPKIPTNIDSIKKFPESFDTYYSDHFGLRDWLTKYYNFLKYSLGDSPSKDVTIGKNGWLFLGSIQNGYNKYSDPIGDTRNINLYSQNDLKRFAKHMTSLKHWLGSKGIKYVFVIAPNKHTIYFDQLPDYISRTAKYSATDQLIEHLKLHTDISVVDLRKIFIKNKNKFQLYYKSDTHWNHYAANIAQYEIMLEIEKLFPNLISPEIMELREDIRGGGDLAGFIGVNNFHESNPQPIFEKTCVLSRTPSDAKDIDPHSFTCEGQELNALIFRDSFFSDLQPYFARKFKKSTYIWERLNYPSLEKYLDLEKTDLIIEEWVERTLPIVPKEIQEFKKTYNARIPGTPYSIIQSTPPPRSPQ